MESKTILKVNNVNAFYSGIQALWDVSFTVEKGEIFAIIGSNGSGKSTLLKTITGIMRPASGEVEFMGKRIDGIAPHSIVELGISHIPEGGRLFPDMSVQENLEMGAYISRVWKERKETLAHIYDIFPVLKDRQGQLARTLSGGEKQMLAVGRGLMSKPLLCLFDEPSYGLSPKFVTEVFHVIESLRERGITILLVEQNVRHTLEIADRAFVIENGRVCLEGRCNELLNSEYVKKAYLGL
ncbi:MAG: ABC transporter ATP-binding protein [Dehalococcoidales bacterium]|nr:ABC transporter ATP-binding protein [Dehalococcoidales bacterium]